MHRDEAIREKDWRSAMALWEAVEGREGDRLKVRTVGDAAG